MTGPSRWRSLLAPLTLALSAAPAWSQAVSSTEPQRPDVLFIVIDDLNDWVGCLNGHPQTRTPNIDRLAARGVLFTNAHAPAPACNPSRAALLTGVAPHRSGLYGQTPNFRDVRPDSVTLPQRLHGLGYTTLGSGKVFHHAYPDPVSWDRFYPSKELQIPPDTARRKLVPVLGSLYGASVDAPATELGDGKVADWIASNLADPPRQPFFLACGFYRPHTPWIAPASSYAKFPLDTVELPAILPDDLDDVPAAGVEMSMNLAATEAEARRAVQAYLACVSFADDQVGRVIDALDASPRAKNTIVVLFGDNGFHLGEKKNWSKLTLWEESTHVPLIVIAPRAKAGARCARPVSLQDLYPTLIELCGAAPVAGVDGTSLLPLLEDPEAEWQRPALSTWGYGNHALRSERWRFIRYADGSEELYDHQQDPNEWKNLAADPSYAEVKADLARWLPTENAPDIARRRR